ncbi:MAG: homoserine dehydrogenase, partial [Candidatus Altiarchaeota archaeon]|nr:homoserine dehydrogenase [Candidatus Altiarchaeota archaeon]
MKSARIAIIGFGVIGRGFAQALQQKKKYLKELGVELNIIAVCEVDGSLVNEKGIDLEKALKGELKKQSDWDSIKAPVVIEKHKPDIVLELTPGNVKDGEPGLGHIKKALSNGISVVTSNKAPLALNYSELMSLAEDNNVKLKFEATVGGAIPIINLYQNTLKINEIRSIYGILNGTSNFVLSKMDEEAIGLDDAVKEAQEL